MNETTAGNVKWLGTTSSSYTPKGEVTVISFKFDEQLQRIEVVFREKLPYTLTVCTGWCDEYGYHNSLSYTPDRVWKEIYGIANGRIALLKVINGTVTPSQTLPEEIEFGE